MANALLYFAVTHDVQVEHKYLIKGHTQMECDSVHATIERQIRDKDIYVPFEFVKYTQEARKEPFPYEVRYLSHNFFLNYDSIQFYDSIRPGRIAGDPVVTDIIACDTMQMAILHSSLALTILTIQNYLGDLSH